MSASQVRQVEVLAGLNVEIPDKLYFKIGEVSQLVGVQAHVLRYWEKEVPCIRPGKSASNQRRYRRKDVEYFREIRRLLYEERYTLAGARKRLMGGGDRGRDPAAIVADLARPAVADGSASGLDLQRLQGGHDPGLKPELQQVRHALTPNESHTAGASPPPTPVREGDALDPGCLQRVREGLQDLIRLAGEEP